MRTDGSLVCLVEELLDVSLDVAGEEPSAVALEWHPIRPNEELLEIPGHVVSADGAPDDQLGVGHQGGRLIAGEWELLPQERKQGMGVLPVHVHFLQKLELGLEAISGTDILQRHEDFFILAVLLHGVDEIEDYVKSCGTRKLLHLLKMHYTNVISK